MATRTGILLAVIAAAAALAYQIGARLSDEAIMTMVGVLCGIVASIPVSLGLLIALTRERARMRDDYVSEREPTIIVDPAPAPYTPAPAPTFPQMPQTPYPPVLLVAPPQYPPASNYLAPYAPSPNAAPPPPIERDFKIVGEEESE